MLCNKFFNTPKLQEDIHLSEQIGYFKNLTKDNYLNAQLNFRKYFATDEQRM